MICIPALFASFITGYTLAGAVSNSSALLEQQSIIANHTSTKSLDNLTVDSQSTPVNAKAFWLKMALLPLEMREEIMSKPWQSSSLAALPIEMRPLLTSVRHVIVNNITAFATVVNALQNLKTIDLTKLYWKLNFNQDKLLMVKMLANIMERQVKRPPLVKGLNDLFIAAIDDDMLYRNQYDIIRVFLSSPGLLAKIDLTASDYYAIYLASKYDDAEVFKFFLNDTRVHPTIIQRIIFLGASRIGHADVVKSLLSDSRSDPAYLNNFAIRYASKNGHTEIVKLLLADGRVDPTANNNYAFRIAKKMVTVK